MKNRKTAYIMVPVVLAIWGMIGWKVYAAMKDVQPVVKNAVDKKTDLSPSKIPNTISLIADYRDPFLDKNIPAKINSKNENRNSKPAIVKIPPASKVEPAWPKITYHGLIKRTNEQKMVGFLSVNGESYFIKGEEAAGEVFVGKLWKDSAEIIFGKEKKIVKK